MRRPGPRDRLPNRDRRYAKASSAVSSWLNFTPLSLSPELWLDASNVSTITESGGAVSQWNDLGPNGRHFTQAVAVDQPTTGSATINGLNAISFRTSRRYLQGSNASDWFFLSSGSNYFVAVALVVGVTSNPNVRYPILGNTAYASESPTTPNASFFFGYDDRSSVSRDNTGVLASGQLGPTLNTNVLVSPNGSLPAITPTVMTAYADLTKVTANQRGYLNLNGSSPVGTNTSTATSTANPFNPLAIGWRDNLSSTSAFVGDIGEIVIVKGNNATEANRFALSNYLRRKWGAQ